jgi:hypothetical protein
MSAYGDAVDQGNMTIQSLNTVEGLSLAIQTLSGFNEAVRIRHEAGYNDRLRLNEFVVLGTWFMDTCGNCMKRCDKGTIGQDDRPEPKAPADVMTHNDYWAWRKAMGLSECISFGHLSHIPPTRMVCPVCHCGWTMKTVNDVERTSENTILMSLRAYEGMTYGEVLEQLALRSDAIFIPVENEIRNNKYIDLTPKYPEPKNEYEKKQVVNERGFVKVERDHVIEAEDQGFFWKFVYYHPKCRQIELATWTEKRFKQVFDNAGYEAYFLKAERNGYGSTSYNGPWFRAVLPFGELMVGWRKRVIEITTQEGCRGLDMAKLFADEDVTKSGTCVHAWGWEKATEYLRKIREALT